MAKYISTDELKKHNKAGDLWLSIHGKVYDVSEWVQTHPGGSLPLTTLAGQDVTDSFLALHPPAAWKHLSRHSNGYFLNDHAVSDVSRDYRKLAADFTEMGLFERKGHGVLLSLCFISLIFAASVYGVVCSEVWWAHLGSGGLMGFLWIQSGWLGHDSGHYQIMMNKGWNRFAQILTGNCLAGISIGWWNWNHNAHHISCNSLDFDPDLQHMPLFAVSSKLFSSLHSCFYDRKMIFHSSARFFISHQHWTFYPVMCLARLNLFSQSFSLLLSARKVPNRAQELLGLLAFWVWYPYLVSLLPNWGERILFVLASFSITGIQHIQFCLNHFSTSVYVGPPTSSDWFKKQTYGSLNISCPHWMDWFHGGLQFQIEHHLFPRLPRCHLRKVSPFVKELCKKHGLPYACVSFWEANRLTVRTLRRAALEARDLTRPLPPKNLVWEALNTLG
ncbi:unnamed protein product [Cuscuta epithymum]|uniref:Cytochrome b5 heme-binding domain-containing protein n=1 Tax=Cuscuta epithymum TaxID=186058 RepID=A0AAV0DS84_9ASTE|nr:unnamed protein product [Cuscuta epithymum]